jgi:hypothetical protein
MIPFQHLRGSGFVGATVEGSAVVEKFVDAFYGLAPWNDWYVPDVLDNLLLCAEKKPHAKLVCSGRHPVPRHDG